jgi:prophage antirepressor-like protein
MNDLTIYQFDASPVRLVTRNDDIWFVATDVAAVLGYGHTPHMLRLLDEDEKGVHIADTLGGAQEMSIITESGLYHAIFASRRPEAQRFRKWVTSEVLPAIRRTGTYSTPRFAVALMNAPRFQSGNLDATNLSTVMTIIATHPDLRGHLRWNATDRVVEVGGEPMEDWHITIFCTVLHREGLKAAKRMVGDAMVAVARSGLTWRA